MPDPAPKIPALWFDARGCGPSEIALQVQTLDHKHPKIPDTLCLRIRVDGDADASLPLQSRPFVYATASELVDSGFMLHHDHAVALHAQIGAWLAAHPIPAVPGPAADNVAKEP
jgi:hypothetical protein